MQPEPEFVLRNTESNNALYNWDTHNNENRTVASESRNVWSAIHTRRNKRNRDYMPKRIKKPTATNYETLIKEITKVSTHGLNKRRKAKL
jgi:hypothetical protein